MSKAQWFEGSEIGWCWWENIIGLAYYGLDKTLELLIKYLLELRDSVNLRYLLMRLYVVIINLWTTVINVTCNM